MKAWNEIFLLENFVDYARASRDVLAYVRVLSDDGYSSIVIPSRGAMPIYRSAKKAWFAEEARFRTAEQRRNSKLDYINFPLGRELILPFSSDPVKGDKTQSSKDIRHFWTKVLGAIVRREGNSPYLKYYKFIVEQLVQDSWISKLPFHLPDEKFIFIDTVVSGQAVYEIFNAFHAEGLTECHFILLLDKNGGSIKPEYRRAIDEMVAMRRCTLVPVRRLFTEDRGPAVSGVWSTVYPELMSIVRENYNWAADSYGAGSYYIRVANEFDGANNAGYNLPVTVINGVIDTILGISIRNQVSKEEMVEKGVNLEVINETDHQNVCSGNYMIHQLVEKIGEYRPFHKDTTLNLAEPRIISKFPSAEVSVSSSHLVRVRLPDDVISEKILQLNAYLNTSQSVFDVHGYFRNA